MCLIRFVLPFATVQYRKLVCNLSSFFPIFGIAIINAAYSPILSMVTTHPGK